MSTAQTPNDPNLRKEIEEGLAPPTRRGISSQNPKVKRALPLLALALGVILLLFLLFPRGKNSPEQQQPAKEERREPPPPRQVTLPTLSDPLKGAAGAFSGLAGKPELNPEQMRMLEYKAAQLDAGITGERGQTQSVSPTVAVPSTSLGPPPPYATPAMPYHSADFNVPPPGMQVPVTGLEGPQEGRRDPNGRPTESRITATVRPRTLWENDNRLLESKRVPAVLETPIDTSLPGPVRAMITEDVFAESGGRRLLVSGDIALGRVVNTNVQDGQRRIGVSWHRILRRTENNDGIIEIAVASPSGDALGRIGHEGNVNTHFFQRFGYGLLYSIIGAGASMGDTARGDNAASRYREAVTGSLANEAQRTIDAHRIANPTITVPRATPITIIVDKDILFESGQVEGTR